MYSFLSEAYFIRYCEWVYDNNTKFLKLCVKQKEIIKNVGFHENKLSLSQFWIQHGDLKKIVFPFQKFIRIKKKSPI